MTDLAVTTPETICTHRVITLDLLVELEVMPAVTISVTRGDWEQLRDHLPTALLGNLKYCKQALIEMIDALFGFAEGPNVTLIQIIPSGAGMLQLLAMVTDGRRYNASSLWRVSRQEYDVAAWESVTDTLTGIVQLMSRGFTVRPVNEF